MIHLSFIYTLLYKWWCCPVVQHICLTTSKARALATWRVVHVIKHSARQFPSARTPKTHLQHSSVRSNAEEAEALGACRSELQPFDSCSGATQQRQTRCGGGVQRKFVLATQLLLLLRHRVVNDVDVVHRSSFTFDIGCNICSNIVQGP
jgi:hypothetical protein